MKQLSIIIVNYNVRHFLELCLSSVYEALHNLDAEVIVVDNNSPDDSCAMVKERFPEVILIENKDNTGFATANNQGVAIAKGEYLCILNPDTIVAEDTFDRLYAFVTNTDGSSRKSKKEIGAIGTRLVDGTGKFLPECKRNLPTPRVAFNKIFGNGNDYYARHVKYTENGAVPILVGAFMFLKTEIYREVGGFDEQYFMYGEDIDLSHTIELAGYKNYYLGELPVIHFKGESTAKDSKYRKRFYGAMRIFFKKHLRTNMFQDLVVSMGLFVATLSRKRTEQPPQIAPSAYFIVTQNKNLQKALSETLSTSVVIVEDLDSVPAGAEVIFDANTMSYKAVIERLMEYQDRSLTFKIIPKNSTFALGSNSSDGRGSMIQFMAL
ncbi:glycosyltransferase family 2 protein [Dokdonia sinensis]|uniref:Glycosyltransferase family 2 protein n=1 Tax=Dokdonia sinensis TaxID=2479847 RepID=A0A3M0FYC3_9FLAO|nr:glycosyltransferase family 2 protein [Dokdonia sinensis]RMB56877.1 glycosyltransferase family 2 protein [Dokdonia sinensis]